MTTIALALWLAASPLFAWMAGRFIRVGMADRTAIPQEG